MVPPAVCGRKRAVRLRDVVDAIFYIAQSGCQWRMLPKDFPHFDSVPAIDEFRNGIKLDELIRKVRRGKKWTTYRYQWLCDVPLRGDAKAIIVNWLMIETLDADRNVTYRNGFITDLPVNRDNVAVLAACGRARWKAENESNRGKTPGAAATSDIGSGSADRPPLGRLVQSKVVWHRLSGSLW